MLGAPGGAGGRQGRQEGMQACQESPHVCWLMKKMKGRKNVKKGKGKGRKCEGCQRLPCHSEKPVPVCCKSSEGVRRGSVQVALQVR